MSSHASWIVLLSKDCDKCRRIHANRPLRDELAISCPGRIQHKAQWQSWRHLCAFSALHSIASRTKLSEGLRSACGLSTSATINRIGQTTPKEIQHSGGATLYEIGTFLVELTESKTGVFIFGVASGLISAAVVLGTTHVLQNSHVGSVTMLVALSVGFTMAILGWIEAAATRSRRLRVFEDVAKVAEMHH